MLDLCIDSFARVPSLFVCVRWNGGGGGGVEAAETVSESSNALSYVTQ